MKKMIQWVLAAILFGWQSSPIWLSPESRRTIKAHDPSPRWQHWLGSQLWRKSHWENSSPNHATLSISINLSKNSLYFEYLYLTRFYRISSNVQRYNFFLSLSKIKEPNTSKCTYIFGLASGKREKFGLWQEKSPNTKLYQGWIVFSIYIILVLKAIYPSSPWLSG